MKTSIRNALAAAVVLGFTASAESAPLFYEGFDISAQMPPQPGCNTSDFPGGAGTYPFPANWSLRNVDNRTPDPQVSYVNNAWIVRDDFSGDTTQCVAFSTSWYAPVGMADDWMWTPAITLPAGTSVLSWRAIAYDPSFRDGYEVRVSLNAPTGGTGVIGNQLSQSTQIFSVSAEQSSWTAHTVPLSAFGGNTVFIGFRNNTNDKFLLAIDDITVIDNTPDLVAQPAAGYASEYSRAPDGFILDAALGFTAFNAGGVALTNVTGTATFLLDGSPNGAPLNAAPVASLAIGATAPMTFSGSYTFAGSGNWTIEYALGSDQSATEVDAANNTLVVAGPVVGGMDFARDEGPMAGTIGIGAGNGGEIGTQFTLNAPATIGGIRFGMFQAPAMIDDGTGNQIPNPFIGAPLIANLRGWDTSGATPKPGAVIASTPAIAATLEGGVYDEPFTTGLQSLAAGTYVVTVVEPTQGTLLLPLHNNRFTPGTVWVNWPTTPFGDWANLEEFGSSFAKTPEVSMLTELPLFRDGFESTAVGRSVNGAVPAWRAPLPQAKGRPLRQPPPTRLAADH